MAYRTRRVTDALLYALIAQHNAKQEASVSAFFHADTTQVTSASDYRNPTVTALAVTAANATDLATSLTLVNQEKLILNIHFQDPRAHNSAVTAVVATANATDLATANTLANALKTAYNTGGHINASNVHFNNDATNTIAAAAATDQTTLNTLLNELKTDVNAHIISAPLGAMIQIVEA